MRNWRRKEKFKSAAYGDKEKENRQAGGLQALSLLG